MQTTMSQSSGCQKLETSGEKYTKTTRTQPLGFSLGTHATRPFRLFKELLLLGLQGGSKPKALDSEAKNARCSVDDSASAKKKEENDGLDFRAVGEMESTSVIQPKVLPKD